MIATASIESDESLFMAMRNGDQQAGNTLYERYRNQVIGYLVKRFGVHEETAEDLLHGAWLKLLKAVGKFHSDSKFAAWLFVTVRGLAIDHNRRKRPGLFPDGFDCPDNKANSDCDFFDLDAVWKAVDRLTNSQRDAITLVYGFGDSHSEAAKELGISTRGVNTNIHRAMKHLRQRLN